MKFNKPFSPLGPGKRSARVPKRVLVRAAPSKPEAAEVQPDAPKPEVRVYEGPVPGASATGSPPVRPAAPRPRPRAAALQGDEPRRARPSSARFRIFRSHYKSWEALFGEVAGFLTTLGPDRVIGVSHSEDKNEGVVTVWYWS